MSGAVRRFLIITVILALTLTLAGASAEDTPPIWIEKPYIYMPAMTGYGDCAFTATRLLFYHNGIYTYEADWTCEQISGHTVTAYVKIDDLSQNAILMLGGYFSAGTYEFKITGRVGDSAATGTFTVYAVKKPANMPEGIVYDVDQIVFIKPGETFTLDAPKVKLANSVMPDEAIYTVMVERGDSKYPLETTADEADGRHSFRALGEGAYDIQTGVKIAKAFVAIGTSFRIFVAETPNDLSNAFPNLRIAGNKVVMVNEYFVPDYVIASYGPTCGSPVPDDMRFEYTMEFVEGVDCMDFELIPTPNTLGVYLKLIELVSPGGAGRYRLTVECKEYNLSCSAIIQVQPDGDYIETLVAPTDIKLSRSKATMRINEGTKLKVSKYTPAKTTKALRRVVWESANPEIATVDKNGLITGAGIGETVVYAYALTVEGVKNPDVVSACQVSVRPPRVTRLSFAQSELTVNPGDIKDLGAILSVFPLESDDVITWKSSKFKTVSVKNGVITALKPGKAKITAFVKSSKKVKAVINVNVVADE